MTNPTTRQAQLDTERQQIQDASRRLIAGTATRSNGRPTVSALAIEADLPRHRLYEHHADLIAEFVTAGPTPGTATASALQQQLTDAHKRIQALDDTNTILRRQLTTLAAVITELTHEAQTDNIVAMPARRDHGQRS